MTQPCKKDCPDRKGGCSIDCPKWAAWLKFKEPIYQERVNRFHADDILYENSRTFAKSCRHAGQKERGQP